MDLHVKRVRPHSMGLHVKSVRPHSMGLHAIKELYSEASATEVQVARGHLKLEAELDNVVRVVLVLKTNTLQNEGGHGFSSAVSEN